MLKLVAVTVSVALVGVYVGYRVLRADTREAAPATTSPSASPAPLKTLDGPIAEDLQRFEHMGSSKSMRIAGPEDVAPKGAPPPAAPAPNTSGK
jgi:hypothetical protein